mgnify:CR=1 FL=1
MKKLCYIPFERQFSRGKESQEKLQRAKLGHMPLLKRKPYELSNPPDDLNPKDLVFQVRITKEIFKDYQYPIDMFAYTLLFICLNCKMI